MYLSACVVIHILQLHMVSMSRILRMVLNILQTHYASAVHYNYCWDHEKKVSSALRASYSLYMHCHVFQHPQPSAEPRCQLGSLRKGTTKTYKHDNNWLYIGCTMLNEMGKNEATQCLHTVLFYCMYDKRMTAIPWGCLGLLRSILIPDITGTAFVFPWAPVVLPGYYMLEYIHEASLRY